MRTLLTAGGLALAFSLFLTPLFVRLFHRLQLGQFQRGLYLRFQRRQIRRAHQQYAGETNQQDDNSEYQPDHDELASNLALSSVTVFSAVLKYASSCRTNSRPR